MWPWRRKPLSCGATGLKCQFNVVRRMIHYSLDGRVFRVSRLVCHRCGGHALAAKREQPFVPPSWKQDEDTAVEANF